MKKAIGDYLRLRDFFEDGEEEFTTPPPKAVHGCPAEPRAHSGGGKEALTNVLVNHAVKNGELRRVLDPLTCFER
jgi:hypothetical protein